MAPISGDMSMRVYSPPFGLQDSDDEDQFFDANPGIKRANSNDSSDRRQHDENQYVDTRASTSYARPPSTSTTGSVNKSSSHKRIRTKPPAPPQGTKRAAAPIRRLSDIQPNGDQQQRDLSDSDASFSRRPPPKKRVRTAVVPKPSITTYNASVPSSSNQMDVMGKAVPTIDEKAITLPRKKSRKIARPYQPSIPSTFNFTPVTTITPPITYDIETILEKVDELRLHANEQYRNGHYEAALLTYSQALDQYPVGASNVPPPLALLTNRAAAYIALGRWEEALQDMRKSVTYPCDDAEGNVKRFTRYIKCLIVLGKLSGGADDEVHQVIKHTYEQIEALVAETARKAVKPVKTLEEGRKALGDLRKGEVAYRTLEYARSVGDYDSAIQHLEKLFHLHSSSGTKVPSPDEWVFMYVEALFWEGKVRQAEYELDTNNTDHKLRQNPAAYSWISALRLWASGEVENTVIILDGMRMEMKELPSQASRLLHKAYAVNNLFRQIETLVEAKKWAKVKTASEEILRLTSTSNGGPKSHEVILRAETYLGSAEVELLLYDSILLRRKIMLQRPSDQIVDLKERANYARALHALGRVKEAVLECEKALSETPSKNKVYQTGLLELIEFFEGFRDSMLDAKAEVRKRMANAAPHEVLGISATAGKVDIKKAYKTLSLQHHPDKPEGDDEIFKLINEAYHTLISAPATSRTSSSRYR